MTKKPADKWQTNVTSLFTTQEEEKENQLKASLQEYCIEGYALYY